MHSIGGLRLCMGGVCCVSVSVCFVSECQCYACVRCQPMASENSHVLYTLRFIRNYATETLRTRLVQALVTRHLDYCNVVYLDTSNALKIRLQRLSNSGLR